MMRHSTDFLHGMLQQQQKKMETRSAASKIEQHLRDQAVTGRLMARLTSRPGQSGRADGAVTLLHHLIMSWLCCDSPVFRTVDRKFGKAFPQIYTARYVKSHNDVFTWLSFFLRLFWQTAMPVSA